MPERMEVRELERQYKAAINELCEVDQILGKVLGYSRYCDDPKNFPDAKEVDGYCTGEMTPAALAEQAASLIRILRSLKEVIQAQTNLLETQRDLNQAVMAENSSLENLNRELRKKLKK